MAKRFIAGDSLESAKPDTTLDRNGYEVSVDYIGENSKTYIKPEKPTSNTVR